MHAAAEKQRHGVQPPRQFLARAATPSAGAPTINDRVDVDGRPLRSLHRFQPTARWTQEVALRPASDSGMLRVRNASRLGIRTRAEAAHGTAPNDVLRSFTGSRLGSRRPHSRAQSEALQHGADAAVPGAATHGELGFHTLYVPRTLSPLRGELHNSSTNAVMAGAGHAVLARAHFAAEERHQYFHWAASLERERAAFASITLWAECVVCRVMEATAGRPVPDPLRTAVCAMVLDRLVAHRHECGLPAVVGVIKNELFNAVYVGHHVDLSRVVTASSADSTHHRFTGEAAMSSSDGLSVSSRPPPEFIDMKLAARHAKQLEQRVAELQSVDARGQAADAGASIAGLSRRGDVVSSLAKNELMMLLQLRSRARAGECFIVRTFFSAWRDQVRHSQHIADAASAWIRIMTHSSAHFSMTEAFRKWRRYVTARRDTEAKLRRRIAELEQQLAAREAEVAALKGGAGGSSDRLPSSTLGVEQTSRNPRGLTITTAHESMRREDLDSCSNLGDDSPRSSRRSPASSLHRDDSVRGCMSMRLATPTPSQLNLLEHRSPSAASLRTPSEPASLSQIDKMSPGRFLEWWVGVMLANSPFSESVRLTSVDGGLCDGLVYTALLAIVFPERGIDILFSIDDVPTRLKRLVGFFDVLGVPAELITIHEIASANVSNFALLAWIYLQWYEAEREALAGLELSPDTSSMAHLVASRLGITRMIPEAFQLLASKVTFGALALLVQRLRKASRESTAVLSDMGDFTGVKPFYFGEFQSHARLDLDHELSVIVPMLRAHYTELKKVFDFYRGAAQTHQRQHGSGAQSAVMQLRAFWILVEDCKLVTLPGITARSIAEVLPVASPSDRASITQGLTKKQFVEVLVRLSCAVAGVTGRLYDRGGVTETLAGMIETQIMPRAMVSAKLEFKQRVSDVRVQEVLGGPVVAKAISRVFRHYATSADNSGKPVMPRDKFVAMLLDTQLIDKNSQMKKKDIIAIFSEVQDEVPAAGSGENTPLAGNVSAASAGGGSASSPVSSDLANAGGRTSAAGSSFDANESMTQSEFCEGLVAVALFKIPHPLVAVHSRVNQFFNMMFLPAVKLLFSTKK